MKPPTNIDLPFFAYGLFKPGQLAFFQLRELVDNVIDPAHTAGDLLLRDGLPIIDPSEKSGHEVKGTLLTFLPDRAAEAYERISDMEPNKHYRWHEAQVNDKSANVSANVLVGRSPTKGGVLCDDVEWNGWNDPLFTAALEVVEETLKSDKSQQHHPEDPKPSFRLQMAYLLLWSSIERYVSLRYHLGNKVTEKVSRFAKEPAFAESLRRHVKKTREVYRADRPCDKEVLNPQSPDKAVKYYYQVRSNIVHRGKGVVRDYKLLEMSLGELLPIFRAVLKAAEHDADCAINKHYAAV